MKGTVRNLATAFAGESMARNLYGFYAKVAKKEGYEQISALFTLTADQERAHASALFKMIGELRAKGAEVPSAIPVEGGVPSSFGTTADNLRTAMGGENHEHESMYPGFADTAMQEGLADIAARLRAIGEAERHHEDRFAAMLRALETGTLYKKSEEIEWTCRECGYRHHGTEPPQVCPACKHPQSYYEKNPALV